MSLPFYKSYTQRAAWCFLTWCQKMTKLVFPRQAEGEPELFWWREIRNRKMNKETLDTSRVRKTTWRLDLSGRLPATSSHREKRRNQRKVPSILRNQLSSSINSPLSGMYVIRQDIGFHSDNVACRLQSTDLRGKLPGVVPFFISLPSKRKDPSGAKAIRGGPRQGCYQAIWIGWIDWLIDWLWIRCLYRR
jgi:hypothetical protein